MDAAYASLDAFTEKQENSYSITLKTQRSEFEQNTKVTTHEFALYRTGNGTNSLLYMTENDRTVVDEKECDSKQTKLYLGRSGDKFLMLEQNDEEKTLTELEYADFLEMIKTVEEKIPSVFLTIPQITEVDIQLLNTQNVSDASKTGCLSFFTVETRKETEKGYNKIKADFTVFNDVIQLAGAEVMEHSACGKCKSRTTVIIKSTASAVVAIPDEKDFLSSDSKENLQGTKSQGKGDKTS